MQIFQCQPDYHFDIESVEYIYQWSTQWLTLTVKWKVSLHIHPASLSWLQKIIGKSWRTEEC